MRIISCSLLPFFVLSCSAGSGEIHEKRGYKVQANYDHPFFHTQTWSYPWFMIKHEDGSLESTMSDSLGNTIIDTTRLYHTAHCVVNSDTSHVIRFSEALWRNDSLLLQIAEGTASTNDKLDISINAGKVQAVYSTVFFFQYNKSSVSWKTIKKELVLNTDHFKAGDTLRGMIDFSCVQHWHYDDPAVKVAPDDTITVKGPFKCVIE